MFFICCRGFCEICKADFANIYRHVEEQHQPKDHVYECEVCPWQTLRKPDLVRHFWRAHGIIFDDPEPKLVPPFQRMVCCDKCYFRSNDLEGHVCGNKLSAHLGLPIEEKDSEKYVRGFPRDRSRSRGYSVPRDKQQVQANGSSGPNGTQRSKDAERSSRSRQRQVPVGSSGPRSTTGASKRQRVGSSGPGARVTASIGAPGGVFDLAPRRITVSLPSEDVNAPTETSQGTQVEVNVTNKRTQTEMRTLSSLEVFELRQSVTSVRDVEILSDGTRKVKGNFIVIPCANPSAVELWRLTQVPKQQSTGPKLPVKEEMAEKPKPVVESFEPVVISDDNTSNADVDMVDIGLSLVDDFEFSTTE